MSLIVLDASAVAAWALPSQQSASADTLLRDSDRHRFLVPQMFPIEVRSLLLAAERREKWRPADTESVLTELAELDISVMRLDDPAHLPELMSLARACGLNIYDTHYLHLAEREKAVLASRDRPLLAAAERRRVEQIDLNV
jgi:predicted nucleic acid-binding protein